MPLETASYIADLVATNPLSSDAVGQGDDHLRLLKSTLQATFPNLGNRFARPISTPAGYTVLSSDNTAVIAVPDATAATLTHTVSLPALSSITAGFYVDLRLNSVGDVAIIVPTGGASIEGSASLTIGPRVYARAYYDGTTWKLNRLPLTDETGVLNITGGVSISGALSLASTLSVSGGAHLKSTLSVSGATTLGGQVTIVGSTVFNSSVSISGNATILGTTTISGATVLKTTLSVGGSVVLGDLLIVSGALTAQSTLSVSGAAHFTTTVSIGGAATLGGATTISGAATLLGTLSVSGAATFAGAMSVSGASHFKTTVSVGGAATLGGAVTISGAATLLGTMSVSGAAHFKTTVSIDGAATLGGAVTVSGAATFLGAVTISGAATLHTTLSVSGAAHFKSQVSISATLVQLGLLNLTGGQIKFPASQNASADGNTLDDYEEGSWTPTITFATPGDLSVTYSLQAGTYIKIGSKVSLWGRVATSAFTHTTAAGDARIGGFPFANGGVSFGSGNIALASNFGNANVEDVAPLIGTSDSHMAFNGITWGVSTTSATLTVTEFPSGNNKDVIVVLEYNTIT